VPIELAGGHDATPTRPGLPPPPAPVR